MLGQHLYDFVRTNGRVDILTQTGQEAIKSLFVLPWLGYKPLDAFNVALSNFGYVCGPLLPIPFVPHLLHHLGIDGTLHLCHLREGELYYLRWFVFSRILAPLGSIMRDNTANRYCTTAAWPFMIQGNPVDHGAESVVVRTQGVEHRPDH